MITYDNNDVIVMQIIITMALMISLAVGVADNETFDEMLFITRATCQRGHRSIEPLIALHQSRGRSREKTRSAFTLDVLNIR